MIFFSIGNTHARNVASTNIKLNRSIVFGVLSVLYLFHMTIF